MDDLNVIYHENVFESAEDIFKQLEAEIEYLPTEHSQLHIKGKKRTITRQIAAFGDPDLTYTFSGLTVACKNWTPLILDIKSAVESLSGAEYNFVLVNRYKDGNSYIGQHKDAESDLDEDSTIASVSFGETRKIIFKKPNQDDRSIDLEHNSLLIMTQPNIREWTHGIPKQKDRKGVRINLTFRKIISIDNKRKAPEVLAEDCKKVKYEESRGVFKESMIPEDVFAIGDSMFVVASIFRGNVLVHLRRYKKFGETYYPTKEGITLQPWWISYIMGRQDVPKTASDLQGGVYLPENQIKIVSTDFVNFTFTRIMNSETLNRTITITDNQWRQMLKQYKNISTVVSDYVFSAVNFLNVYNDLFTDPIDENLPGSLDISLGRQYLLEVLQSSLCDYLKANSGMKEPEVPDCEEVWGNRTERFNTAALATDFNELAHYFNNNIWEDEAFLTLKPAMYVTTSFLKMIRLDDILKQARTVLCP